MRPCGNPTEDQRETDLKMAAGKSILYMPPLDHRLIAMVTVQSTHSIVLS